MAWLPRRLFRPRGLVLLTLGVLALLFALMLGRRDLLVVAIFALALPLLASAGLHLFHPGFTVRRSISPEFVQTGTTASVTLEVHGTTPGGASARITETLPPHLISVPTFDYPKPVEPRSLLSRYSYTLRPSRRGLFTIGPLSAKFADPFDVAYLKRDLDSGDTLAVAPAAVRLPEISLTGGRGQDGSRMTRQQANPSDDDVMTRDYRHGDPLRRVHWPATARAGKLMVRSEESVTTPEAALILDQRLWAFGGTERSLHHAPTKDSLLSTAGFEWAVIAAVSVATHLLDRSFSLRVLDHAGLPGFASSRSAAEPGREDFSGPPGALAVAQSLAALELGADRGTHRGPFGELVAEKLLQTRRRGPIVAITGLLTTVDAMILASAYEAAEGAIALVVCEKPHDVQEALALLRRAGWHAVAVSAGTSVADAWTSFENSGPAAVQGGRR